MLIEKLARHIRTLRWVIPLATIIIVVLFQLGPARWIQAEFGQTWQNIAEILFYGTTGPLVVFLFLDFFGRWLEEKETSELQARVLAQASAKVKASRELSDTALQTLFAASTLLASLKYASPELSPKTAATLRETEKALDQAIHEIRSHLLEEPEPKPVSPVVEAK